MLSIHASGTRCSDPFLTLHVQGQLLSDAGPRSIVWMDEHPIRQGQRLEVKFTESGATTLQAMDPDGLHPPDPNLDAEIEELLEKGPAETMMNELRSRPWRNGPYSIEYGSTSGMAYAGHVQKDGYSVSLSVVWTHFVRQRSIRVALSSSTLDSLQNRRMPQRHVEETLDVGQSFTMVIDA